MDQMLRVSLYDLTGYLIPGLVVVWSLIYVWNETRQHQKTDPFKVSRFKLIVAGYISGHLLQAIAALIDHQLPSKLRLSEYWRPLDQLYSDDASFRDALQGAINSAFSNAGQKRPFPLCQAYVHIHGLDAYTDIMQARSGLFRGLAIALFISGCAVALEWFRRRQEKHRRHMLIIACLLFVGSAVSLERMHTFESYFVKGIYHTFYVDTLSKAKAGTSPSNSLPRD